MKQPTMVDGPTDDVCRVPVLLASCSVYLDVGGRELVMAGGGAGSVWCTSKTAEHSIPRGQVGGAGDHGEMAALEAASRGECNALGTGWSHQEQNQAPPIP